MEIIASILTAVVAIEHCYILWMEMFAWETAGYPNEISRVRKGI